MSLLILFLKCRIFFHCSDEIWNVCNPEFLRASNHGAAAAGFLWWLNTQPYDAAHTAARHAGGGGACGRGAGRGEGKKEMIRFLSHNLSPANSGLTEGQCSAGVGIFFVNYFILFLFLPFFRLDSSLLDQTPPPPPTILHHIACCSCLTPTQPSTVSKESEERLTHLIFYLPSDWQENYPGRDFSIYFQIEGVTACLSSLPPPSFFILSFLTFLHSCFTFSRSILICLEFEPSYSDGVAFITPNPPPRWQNWFTTCYLGQRFSYMDML